DAEERGAVRGAPFGEGGEVVEVADAPVGGTADGVEVGFDAEAFARWGDAGVRGDDESLAGFRARSASAEREVKPIVAGADERREADVDDVGRVPIDGAGEGRALATLVFEGARVLDPRVGAGRGNRVGNAEAERAVPGFRLAHDAHGREDLAMLAFVEREHRLANVGLARCVDAHRGGECDARRVGRAARFAAGLVDVLIEDPEPRGERVERRHGRQPRTGRRTSAPNGGSTRAIDCSNPCSGSGSVSTRASVRTPLPPKCVASLENTSTYSPAACAPIRYCSRGTGVILSTT